uniref:Letm1 RBD domain-containing protein n=1 Tax=Alexandrium monilatum TaxID=311494 RepID=A0A7S4WAF7_9DINO
MEAAPNVLPVFSIAGPGGGCLRQRRAVRAAATGAAVAAAAAAAAAGHARGAFLTGAVLDRMSSLSSSSPAGSTPPAASRNSHYSLVAGPWLAETVLRQAGAAPAVQEEQQPRAYSVAAPLVAAAAAGAASLQRKRSNALCGSLRRSRRISQAAVLSAEMEAAVDRSFGDSTSVAGSGMDVPASFDSDLVQRLKDLVFIKEMRAAITSGEFALRLRGAERPGLVDYEDLCNRLNTFIDRLERQPPQLDVLPQDEAWKAQEELKLTRSRLEERLVEMTRVKCQSGTSEETPNQAVDVEAAAKPKAPTPVKKPTPGGGKQPRASPEPSRILLYLREDQTVDIDSALKESCSMAPFSSDLWERLRGKDHREHDDWPQEVEDVPMPKSRVPNKQASLDQAKHELAKAQAMRAKIIRAMGTGNKTEGIDPQTQVEETKQLFHWDREITGRRILVLLASMDLLYQRVAEELETQLRRASIKDWDNMGHHLKALVFEFSLLDKQSAPYQRFAQEYPEEVAGHDAEAAGKEARWKRCRRLDSDEIRMLEAHIARIADRLGVEADCVGQETGVFRPLRHQWLRAKKSLRKVKRAVLFYGNGMRLLSHDLQHAVKLVLKMAFLNYTLQPREVQTCYRAAKDVFVLIPFLIILLIPLSPPGHVLVFSLIMKVYPDFFPSPFTERRQNVMRIYDEIKPADQTRKAWS